MGLAWPSLAQTGANPFWLALTESGALENPLFAFSLARFSDVSSATSTETKGGNMDIGFTDSSHFSGSINYISLAQENYWLIPLQAITINGNKLNPGGNAAIDT
jgi:cathepsin D